MYMRASGRQDVRRSQFITTYGPGAIIEGRNGPAVILMPEIGLFKHTGFHPSDFEIKCENLSRVIGGRIFRVPSNQELKREEPIYRTKIFPEWHLCPRNEKHPSFSVLYKGSQCPVCYKATDHRQAVRFVMACPRGHLDDVDWERAIHEGTRCDKSRGRQPFFLWYRDGPTLRDIRIVCAFCKKSASMGDIYYREWLECSARYPEREDVVGPPIRPYTCRFNPEDRRKPGILHRGALNLRIPVIRSAIRIPPVMSRLHELMADETVKAVVRTLKSMSMLNEDNLKKGLKQNGVEDRIINEIASHSIEEILHVLKELEGYEAPKTYSQMLAQEFRALRTAAAQGASLEDFEVPLSEVKIYETAGPIKVSFRIAPVTRLRVVMVQEGYIRVDPAEGDEVLLCYQESVASDRIENWFLGVELKGEGIFIDIISPSNFMPYGNAAREWSSLYHRFSRGGEYKDQLFRDPAIRIELHPLFIWWHSLSHKLISWLAIDSGYSAASLRERVYCDGNAGGVLIYTSQPGGDGSLGGLYGLIDRFEEILKNAYLSANFCSNDPFCSEVSVNEGSYAGAACYACLLLPETSCEHRNMWLDRRLLIENPFFGES